jgi:hypothetical protein
MQPLSLVLASAVFLGAATSTTSIAGTVAYYRFDEGTPDKIASGVGTIFDHSGNGLNGTALNGPVYKSTVALPVIPHTGASNARSMQFSGTGGQRVFVKDSEQFAIPGSLTIEAYFNVFATPNAAGAILFRGDNRSGLDPYFLNVQEGLVRFGINNSANEETLVTAPLPGLNQWIYAAGVLDTAKGTMSLYINGELVKSISTSATPLVHVDPNEEPGIGIGGLPSSSFGDFMSFDGLIDEVKLSDTALTPDQFLNAPANGERIGRSSTQPQAQVAPAPPLQRSPVQIARERLELAERGLKMVEERQKTGLDGGVEEAKWTRRRALAAADLPDRTERLAILEDCLKRMDHQIEQVQQFYEMATADYSDVLSVKFNALEVELLVAKAREAR